MIYCFVNIIQVQNMGFKDIFKKKEEQNYNDLLRKNKITLDEAIDGVAVNFVMMHFWFYDETVKANMFSNEHNEEIKGHSKLIQEMKEKNPEDFNAIDRMVAYDLTYEDRELLKNFYIGDRNKMSLTFATYFLDQIHTFEEIKNVKIDKDEFLDHCLKPEIVEKGRDKLLSKTKFTQSIPLARFSIERFYNMVLHRQNMLITGESCYNENGFIIDEDGELMEVDIIEDMFMPSGLEGILSKEEVTLDDALEEVRKYTNGQTSE